MLYHNFLIHLIIFTFFIIITSTSWSDTFDHWNKNCKNNETSDPVFRGRRFNHFGHGRIDD